MNQYHVEVSIIIAEPSEEWIRYLKHGRKSVYMASLRDEDMLSMRRVGTFSLRRPTDMYSLVAFLAAILVKDRPDQMTWSVRLL